MPGVLKSLEYTQRVRGLSKVSPELKVVSMDDEVSKKLRSNVYGNEKILPNEEQRLKEGSYLSEKQNVNGHQANGTQPYLSGAPPDFATSSEEMVSQVPPEIGHVTFGFLSLSTLITRLVQETFNGLTDLINEMSDLQVLQPGGKPSFSQSDLQVNGNKAVNNSHVNNSKKMLMLTFAQERRAQFIKVLVLSKWSRQAEEISKVIDLNFWLEEQKQLYANATWWMGELKRILGPIKMPNPDLKTALEVLSLGKALRLPDVRFVFTAFQHTRD